MGGRGPKGGLGGGPVGGCKWMGPLFVLARRCDFFSTKR